MQSGGGLGYRTDGELLLAMRRMIHDDELRAELAARGFARRIGEWSEAEHIYNYMRLDRSMPGWPGTETGVPASSRAGGRGRGPSEGGGDAEEKEALMGRFGAIIVPWAVLGVLGVACFARLFADPSGLVVDGRRPSIDFANRGEPRPLGNDVTFLFLPHHLYVAKRLAEFGHPPTWDSSGFSGRPMIGNPQSGLFYPPVWLAWASSNPASLGWLTRGAPALGRPGCLRSGTRGGAQPVGGHRGRRGVPSITVPAGPNLRGALPACLGGKLVSLGVPGVRRVKERPGGRRAGPAADPDVLLPGRPPPGMVPPGDHAVDLGGLGCGGWPGSGQASQPRALEHGLQAGPQFWRSVLAWPLSSWFPQYKVLPWVQKGPQTEAGVFAPRNYQVNLVSGFQLLAPGALGGPADYFGVDNYWESVLSVGLAPMVLLGVAVVASRQRGKARGWVDAGGSLGLVRHRTAVQHFRPPELALYRG